LTGEHGYFFTNLVSAVQFIDSVDEARLTIDHDEYYGHMQAAKIIVQQREQEEQKAYDRRRNYHMNNALTNDRATSQGTADAKSQTVAMQSSPPASLSPSPPSAPSIVHTSDIGDPVPTPNSPSAELQSPIEHDEDDISKQFRFFNIKLTDVRFSDLPKLLQEYKDMAQMLIKLQTRRRF
jgi:hypothetical protein